MKGGVAFLLALVSLSLFSLAAVSLGSKENFKESLQNISFKTFTSAVCENKNGLLYCKDEMFIDCNGKISKADEVQECNGFKIENKVTGFSVLEPSK